MMLDEDGNGLVLLDCERWTTKSGMMDVWLCILYNV